jgi:hypothetical protein
MMPFRKKRLCPTALLIAASVPTALAGCGEDFKDRPRTPVPIELGGVIRPSRVIVSPRKVGAGPVAITISNQTDEAHTVTLEGASVRERVGPVAPEDTATIQKTLSQGTYEVRAGSGEEGSSIRPAVLVVGRPRAPSNDRTQLP